MSGPPTGHSPQRPEGAASGHRLPGPSRRLPSPASTGSRPPHAEAVTMSRQNRNPHPTQSFGGVGRNARVMSEFTPR